MAAITEFHLQSVMSMLHNSYLALSVVCPSICFFNLILAAMITPCIVLARIVVKQVVSFSLSLFRNFFLKARIIEGEKAF